MKNRIYLKSAILLAFISILLVNHFFGYLGHFGYDDMHYARLANDLSNGVFNANDHYSFRLTLIGLTSLSYQLFGVNDFASALPSLLISILSLLLVFGMLRKERTAILVLGLSFFSLNYWTLFYSDKLMPDSFVAFFVLLTLFFIYEFKFRKTKLPTGLYAFAAALAVFLGFNSKGTIILLLPLLAYFFILDLVKNRDRKFWLLFAGFSLVFIFGYLVFWQLHSGSAAVRFQAITQNSYLNLCSYSEQPFIFTLKRIGYGLILLFISHALITPFIFLLANPKKTFKKETYLFNDELSFFISSAVILFLSSNFMSISAGSYSPMCLDPRHYLFIVPIASIAAALVFKNAPKDKNVELRLLIISVILLVIAFINRYDTVWVLYFPLFIVFLLVYFMKRHPKKELIFVALLFVVLLINPIKMAQYANHVNFNKQEQIVKEQLLSQKEPCLIVTDQVQKNLASYLSGFDKNSGCTFLTYDEFVIPENEIGKPVFLLKNWYTGYLSNLEEQRLPYYAKMTQNQEKVFEDSALNIQIYRLTDFSQPSKLFESDNNFETSSIGWSDSRLDKQHIYSGSYSSVVDEYSSTFKISLDSLKLAPMNQLIISASCYLDLIDESDPQMVISIEKEQKNEFWKGISLKKQIKSYGNWLPVSVNEIINLKDIKTNGTLSIYIWNREKSELYLDDFKIELLGIE